MAAVCAICKKSIPADPRRRPGPFCSENCRTIDLGRWADGAYRVPVTEEESDVDESAPRHELN